MAELARLGIVVHADGVEDAAAKLGQLSDTGQAAAGSLFYMSDGSDKAAASHEKHGASAFGASGHLHGLREVIHLATSELGFMGPAAMAVSLTLRNFGEAGVLAAGLLGGLAVGWKLATAGAEAYGKEMDKMISGIRDRNIKGLQTEIEDLTKVTRGRESSGGGLIATATENFALSGRYIGGLLSGGPEGMRNQEAWRATTQAREALEQVQLQAYTKENRIIKDQIALIGVDEPTAIRLAADALERDLIAKYEKLGIKTAESRKQARELAQEDAYRKQGASASTAVDEATKLTQALVLQAAQHTMSAHAVAQLSTEFQVNDLWMSKLGKDYPELARQTESYIRSVNGLTEAHRQMAEGEKALHAAEQEFGVVSPSTKATEARTSAQSFGDIFKNQKAFGFSDNDITQMFSQLVTKLEGAGTKDIPGLLTSKMGADLSQTQYDRLRASLSDLTTGYKEVQTVEAQWSYNAFGGSQRLADEIKTTLVPVLGKDLVAAMDQSQTGMNAWGQGFETQTTKAAAGFRKIAIEIEGVDARLKALADTILNMPVVDLGQAAAGLPAIEQQIQQSTGNTPPGLRVFN